MIKLINILSEIKVINSKSKLNVVGHENNENKVSMWEYYDSHIPNYSGYIEKNKNRINFPSVMPDKKVEDLLKKRGIPIIIENENDLIVPLEFVNFVREDF